MDYSSWSAWKKEDILANGVRVWHRHAPSQTATLCAIIDAGSRHDGAYPGIAHFTEHMLFQGTKNFPDEQIKLMAAENGIRMNASTSKEFMTVDLESILPDKINAAFDICYEVVTSPSFPQAAFDKERSVVLNEIRDKEDRPLSKALELASSLICEHPFKIPVLGTKDSIVGLKVDDMRRFHANRFKPVHVTICYAGSMEMGEFVAMCNAKFGGWKVNTPETWDSDKFISHSVPNVINKTNQNQVAVSIAFPGASIESEDKIKLKALCDIIGGGAMISRMFRKLRNDKGLCYFCGAFSQENYAGGGLLTLCGTVSPDQIEDFVNGALEIIESMKRNEPITDQELQTSKTRFKAEMLETVDNLSSYMQWFLYLWIARGTRDIGRDLEMIDAITIDDLNGALNKYFSGNPVITLVGNVPNSDKYKIKLRAEDFQYQAPVSGGYGSYDGAGTVDRPTPAGSHATTPNSTKPPYAPGGKKVENMEDVVEPKAQENEPQTGQETMQDTEPSCIPKTKSACKSCGKEFEHLDGVAVYKCPECKLHDIDSSQPPQKVSIYSKDSSASMQDSYKVATKPTPGRDVISSPIVGAPTPAKKTAPVVAKPIKAPSQSKGKATPGNYREYSEKELNKQAEDQARASEWSGIAKTMREGDQEKGTSVPAPKIPGIDTPQVGRGAPREAQPVKPVNPVGGGFDSQHPRDENGKFAPK
jgi:predicted Zn-dependent peptidase/predicted RNA-binding Zn-ribbon protein involved in translation (DUF1610 family)